MKKSFYWILGIIVGILILGGISIAFRYINEPVLSQKWQELRSEDFDFALQIPVREILEKNLTDLPLAASVGKSFETSSYGCTYFIESFKLKANLSNSAENSLLTEIASSSLKQIAGDIRPYISAPYEDKGMKVVNYGWGMSPTDKVGSGRVRINKSFVYNLKYSCENYDVHNKGIRAKFFDSFKTLNSN